MTKMMPKITPSIRPPPPCVISPLSTIPAFFDPAISTMGPAPLNVPASPSPNKTQKVSGPSVNGTTKQPAAPKNLAPSDISSPHELTAFVRLSLFGSSQLECVG